MYKQQAYTLIEILISLAFFSGAMLSLIAAQLSSYSFLDEARQYAYANQLAYDLFERIRANPRSLHFYLQDDDNPTTLSANHCQTQACNAGFLAAYDRQQWLQRVKEGPLPDAKACLTMVGRRIHLYLAWRDRRDTADRVVACEETTLPHIQRSLLL